MVISSKDNELIKKIKKLKEKKYRNELNCFVVEGIKLVREAIKENANIKQIVVCEGCEADGTINQNLLYEIAKFDCVYVTEAVFKTLSNVEKPQGILAVIERKANNEINYKEDVIVVLDNIQDPGNLGTILRTIDSCALSQVIISNTTVDCYNPKVVRSTMGAIFRVNVVETDNIIQTLKEIKRHKFNIAVTSLEESESIYNIDYKNMAIVMGNEANGVSPEVKAMADKNIKIPMLGRTESLNVAVATSVILYEYVRKKIN